MQCTLMFVLTHVFWATLSFKSNCKRFKLKRTAQRSANTATPHTQTPPAPKLTKPETLYNEARIKNGWALRMKFLRCKSSTLPTASLACDASLHRRKRHTYKVSWKQRDVPSRSCQHSNKLNDTVPSLGGAKRGYFYFAQIKIVRQRMK